MNILTLYAVCDNLNHNTYFEIFKDGVMKDEGYYTHLHAKYSEARIKGFKIRGDGSVVEIYI